MSEDIDQELEKSLTHGTLLKDIKVNTNVKALNCGFPSIEALEYITRGEGNLVVIAARPGNGKSAIACQIALNVSEWGRVLYISPEMTKESLKKRLLAVVSQVPIKKLGERAYVEKVTQGESKLARCNFVIIDDDRIDLAGVLSKIYDEHKRSPLDLVVFDYIGKISYEGDTKHQAISKAIAAFKTKIADRLRIPVIVLAQMRRSYDDKVANYMMAVERARLYPNSDIPRNVDIRPSLDDIADSSVIEHTADVVLFLHRPYLVDPSANPSDFKVFVGKNRHGEVRDFNLEFSQALTQFIDHGLDELQ